MGTIQRALVFALAVFPFAHSHRVLRKSLSFKQPLPHSQFVTNPPSLTHTYGDVTPHDVARFFIQEHLLVRGTSFYIRADSYTDQKTGISHIYARQIVDGLEVADGDINLNIRDGQVISYGSSFFVGPLLGSILSAPGWSQESYCAEIPENSDPFACEVSLGRLHTSATAALRAEYADLASDSPFAAAYLFSLATYPGQLPSDLDMEPAVLTHEDCSDSEFNNDECMTLSLTGAPGVLSPIRVRKVYVQTQAHGQSHTHLNLAWRLEVTMKDNSYEAYISAHDPSKIIASIDWVKDGTTIRKGGWLGGLQGLLFGMVEQAPEEVLETPVSTTATLVSTSSSSDVPGGAYRVWKWGINDPTLGDRTLEVSPYHKTASPLGWHSVPAANDPVNSHPGLSADTVVNFTVTIGNNVIAQSNWAGSREWKNGFRPNGGSDFIFDFPYSADPSDPDWETLVAVEFVNTSVTQQFYLSNMFHDLLYLYGFDEASGNFQQYNFAKGGEEGDGVIVDAQDGSGFSNANFLSPPDGQNGRCRMPLWSIASPFFDGGLDAGVLIHELSHGLSTRLTGGPKNAGCLDSNQAGGMGEGWGDWIAAVVRSTRTYWDYPFGAWAMNSRKGIRHFPYATNQKVNPSMYNYLQRIDYQDHAIGEIWAEILWVMYNGMIEKHGFADSLFPSADAHFYKPSSIAPRKGNTLALQLVVNGLKTQPCRPTFIQARDAIIQADNTLTKGENKCVLWRAFASRGMGTDAKELSRTSRQDINGFKVPRECN